MKKKDLIKRLKQLELDHEKLEKYCIKLERDKLSIYHLLYRVNEELDEALANKQTFIASMSHELRSPLTSVIGNSALLKQTDLSTQQIKYLDQLNESADFLMALLADLLDVSKLKESKIELNIQETHLDKLLIRCASMVESKIAKDVELEVNIPTLDYYVFTDKKRVQQIFINLLTNAAKFTKKGKIEFSMVEIKQIENQLEVIVEVKDTGLGISPEIKETLFEPFSSMDIEEGTGLGLYISHELTTLMGGDIVVETEEKKGSSFRVTFFCEKSSDKVHNLVNDSLVSKQKMKKNYEHINVLIVEDIEVNREFLKEMFKVFFSIDVDTAQNGEIAVNKAKKNTYDIIFMDIRMPVMDGLIATREIRKFNQEVSIICMSANVYREDKHEAKIAGMNGFIEKPLEYTDIEARLEEISPCLVLKDKKKNSLEKIALRYFKEDFDEESSLNFIRMAKSGIKNTLADIQKNLLLENINGLKDNFHSLKGILANLGLEELAQKAGILQDYAYEDDFENIKNRIESFMLEIEEFLN